MTQSNIKGNPEGIKLWNLMASSEDPEEQKYFSRLQTAASKFGSVWFTDIITQRNTSRNQTFFSLKWDEKDKLWNVSLFHVPEGASKQIEDRVVDEWEDVDPDNIIGIDE